MKDRPTPITRARELRAESTPPEGVLWSKLRDRRLRGHKFRRQHPIGPYVVDFYCHEAGLVVEIDSSYHGGNQRRDAARDAWMEAQGLVVFRVDASTLSTNTDGVLAAILDAVSARLGH